MYDAARELENMSYGMLGTSTLDVSWWGPQRTQQKSLLRQSIMGIARAASALRALPQHGPAVGRPAEPVVQGRSLEAVNA